MAADTDRTGLVPRLLRNPVSRRALQGVWFFCTDSGFHRQCRSGCTAGGLLTWPGTGTAPPASRHENLITD